MKIKNIFILMTIIGLILTGCGETDGSDDTETDTGAAEGYPDRAIDFYVGYGAGGGTDIFARQVARQLEDVLDTDINVVNQVGGEGTISLETVANQPADGYTVAAISLFPISTADGVNKNGLDVFQPVARFQHDTLGLMVPSGSFEDIDDFISQAEERPGEISIGGVAARSPDRVGSELFMQETGIDLNYVPFDGTGDAIAALLGGHVDALMEDPGPMAEYMSAGDVTPLLFMAEDRLSDFPDTPVSVEKGWDITYGVERGFAINRETPDEIINVLEEAMEEVYNSDEYQEYAEESFLHYKEGWMNSEDYEAKLEEDIEMFKGILENID